MSDASQVSDVLKCLGIEAPDRDSDAQDRDQDQDSENTASRVETRQCLEASYHCIKEGRYLLMSFTLLQLKYETARPGNCSRMHLDRQEMNFHIVKLQQLLSTSSWGRSGVSWSISGCSK